MTDERERFWAGDGWRGRERLPYLEDNKLWNLTIDELVRQRDEAREIARELAALCRATYRSLDADELCYGVDEEELAWAQLPVWLQRYLSE